MSILALDNYCGDLSLKNKALMSDSSFILARADPTGEFFHDVQNFKDTNKDTTFFFNATVRQELLRVMRYGLIIQSVNQRGQFPKWIQNICYKRQRMIGKDILSGRDDGAAFLRKALQGKIQAKLNIHEAGFVYESSRAKAIDWNKEWPNLVKVMEDYGLDSSDAMIVHFAIRMGYSGLVTCDADFNTVNNVRGFDVYMPHRLIWKSNLPTEK